MILLIYPKTEARLAWMCLFYIKLILTFYFHFQVGIFDENCNPSG